MQCIVCLCNTDIVYSSYSSMGAMQNTNVVVVGVFLDSFYNYRWQDLHACEKRNFPVLAYIPYLQQFSVVFFIVN